MNDLLRFTGAVRRDPRIEAWFSGFADPVDNGYVVFCLPKSRFALQDANRWLRANNQSLFPDGSEVEGLQPLQPPQN